MKTLDPESKCHYLDTAKVDAFVERANSALPEEFKISRESVTQDMYGFTTEAFREIIALKSAAKDGTSIGTCKFSRTRWGMLNAPYCKDSDERAIERMMEKQRANQGAGPDRAGAAAAQGLGAAVRATAPLCWTTKPGAGTRLVPRTPHWPQHFGQSKQIGSRTRIRRRRRRRTKKRCMTMTMMVVVVR